MRRPTVIPALLALCACAESQGVVEEARGLVQRGDTVSSMNYLQAPIDAVCAKTAVLDTEGFGLRGDLVRRGDAQRFEAVFNRDLPVSVIVRSRRDGTGEVSAFSRLARGATPLDRREAEYAVTTADEAIYRACTEDGREGGGDVVIEAG